MLFTIKNQFAPTLILAALLGLTSLFARSALALRWEHAPFLTTLVQAAVGLALILTSDGLVHGALLFFGRGRYRARYHRLVAYFRPQGPREIGASGVLAAGEEMLFRGVLLTALAQRAGWSPWAAVAATALLFGALHLIRAPGLGPFALWAVWEGALLGGLYLATGSLVALMLIHAAHDIGGFTVMAWQRRRERGTGPARGEP